MDEIEIKNDFQKVEREIKRLEQILIHDDETTEYWNNIDRLNEERAQIISRANAQNVNLFK